MSVIVPQAALHYLARMGFRSLFAILVLFAMLFAPLGVSSDSAKAMIPAADHYAQMMEGGHCDEQPAKGKDSMSDGKSCCVAMCTAITVEPMTASEPHALAPSPIRPSLAQFDPSFLAKLPTPPPRRS